MERISCTVDELAEALAVTLPVHVFTASPTHTAREVASFLNADRLPEPLTDTSEDWIYE